MELILTKMEEALNSHVRRVQVIYIWDKDFVKKCNMEEMLQRGNDGEQGSRGESSTT